MGKVRRLRQKYHASCKPSSSSQASVQLPLSVPCTISGKAAASANLSTESNIFKGVNISIANLQQNLLPISRDLHFDSGCMFSEKDKRMAVDRSGMTVSKKNKRLARRISLLKNIAVAQKMKAEAKHLKKFPSAPPPINVKELINALPVITQEMKGKGAYKVEFSNRKVVPFKQGKHGSLQKNMEVFKSISSNELFQADPLSAISNYIKNTVNT